MISDARCNPRADLLENEASASTHLELPQAVVIHLRQASLISNIPPSRSSPSIGTSAARQDRHIQASAAGYPCPHTERCNTSALPRYPSQPRSPAGPSNPVKQTAPSTTSLPVNISDSLHFWGLLSRCNTQQGSHILQPCILSKHVGDMCPSPAEPPSAHRM